MTDLYAQCPCGSGKKIKFCCKDIIADIEKIERMIRGDQRTGALDKIERLLEKHPSRPALLGMKVRILLDQHQPQEAWKVAEALLEAEPENPTGLAYRALLEAQEGKLRDALRDLHAALRASGHVMSSSVYRAYMTVCYHLIEAGEAVAAYAHLLTIVGITKGEERTSVSMLMELTSSNDLPLIFQGLMVTPEAPENASWKREFDLAMDSYAANDWTRAAEMFRDMNARILDEPILLRNQAILDLWTCHEETAVKAFHEFAAIRDIDRDEAVEAEACAQMLDKPADAEMITIEDVTCPLDDVESVMERLLSLDNVRSMPVKPEHEGPVPPKGLFIIFDAPLPSEEEVPTDVFSLPREICHVAVYGKETDQPARVRFLIGADDRYDASLEKLASSLGIDLSGDQMQKVVIGQVPRFRHVSRPDFWVPANTTVDGMRALREAWLKHQVFEVWPQLPVTALGNKSPLEAAKEKKLQRKVLASVLNLELAHENSPLDLDFNALREQLGLPRTASLDPADVNLNRLSPVQVKWLDVEKLDAEQLADVYHAVSLRPAGRTNHRIGMEILRRGEEMVDKVDLIEVRARLAESATSSDESLEHLAAARDLAISRGESPANWLIAELDHRFQRREMETAQRIITEIQTRYIREPGVAQNFAALLARYGLLPAAPSGAPARSMPPAPTPAAAAASGGGIWTPDAPAASSTTASDSESEDGESKLWIPGME